MIELTAYDGYRIGDKISVMVSRIIRVAEMMDNTSLLSMETGHGTMEVTVLESRETVHALVNAYLFTQRPSAPGHY